MLARNITRTVRYGKEKASLDPFLYETKGLLAALGRYKGVGRIGKFRLRGFAAWWVWRHLKHSRTDDDETPHAVGTHGE